MNNAIKSTPKVGRPKIKMESHLTRSKQLRAILEATKGNVSQTAKILGIGRRTAYHWIAMYAIIPSDFRKVQ